jgi:peroxiredoxin Q/BCP
MPKLNPGDKAPDFSAIDQDGKVHALKDYRGKKVALYFYPKDMTSGCTKEACNLRDNFSTLRRRNIVVLGVSPDKEQSHKKFAEKYDLPFPLLVDSDKKIMKAYGAWGKKNLYGRIFNGVLRSTYVIDEKGVIQAFIGKVQTDDHASQILKAIES